MSEPTLLEDLEELAAWVQVPAPPEPASAARYAARLRAAATRLAAEFESQRWLWDVNDKAVDKPGCHTQLAVLAALDRVNGGSSPPITPGSPPADEGPVTQASPDTLRRLGEMTAKWPMSCVLEPPASPPTTPTCTCIPGSKGEPHAYWCPAETTCASCGRPLQPPGKIQCCSSPLPRTTPTCASWCGDEYGPTTEFWNDHRHFCSAACRDAGSPLHPRTP